MRTTRQIALTLSLLALFAGTVPAAEPSIGAPTVLATGIAGPEGIAATRQGDLVVGTTPGDLIRISETGVQTPIASLGESLAGVTVLKDGRILACAFGADRVWVVDGAGTPSVLASGIDGPNFAVQERRLGRIYVSASFAGTIVDVTDGTPVVRASGLAFPNGLAIGKEAGQRYLYVAELVPGRVSRIFLNIDGSLGASEVYATGMPLIDGIAFDRRGNLLAVGGGALYVVHAGTHEVELLANAAPLDFPSNLAFGRRRAGRRTLFLANYGNPLGSGTDVVAVPYSIRGAKTVQ
jgi:sugar lactone lactonase YvrE